MPRTTVRMVLMLVLAVATSCRAVVPATPSPSGLPSDTAAASAQPTLPADFPVMPGATQASGSDAGPGVIATWMTDADGPQVYDFYVAALPAAAFSIVGLYPGGSVATIRLQRQGDPILKLVITGETSGSSTKVQLRVDGP
jgi:hypothetical protein